MKEFVTKKIILAIIIILLSLFVFIRKNAQKPASILKSSEPASREWNIKSVDTMKYSRDVAAAKINDLTFDEFINSYTRAVKDSKASHIAIGTPYDERFYPFLKRWVSAARKYDLNVWFRGNFSGWEGWFGFEKGQTRTQHTEMLEAFIQKNQDLFENGDIFSPCPECENGGPGDPRRTDDVEGHRKFLIEERNTALLEFKKVGKKIMVVDSMNFDVAKLVMDKETASAMGKVVGIDHYVKSPQKLADDIERLSQSTDSQIFLGEFGVPIPDIHGDLTPEAQARWIDEALNLVGKNKNVIGLNYWVGVGGSTAIFNPDFTPKPAAEILRKYFSLTTLD